MCGGIKRKCIKLKRKDMSLIVEVIKMDHDNQSLSGKDSAQKYTSPPPIRFTPDKNRFVKTEGFLS